MTSDKLMATISQCCVDLERLDLQGSGWTNIRAVAINFPDLKNLNVAGCCDRLSVRQIDQKLLAESCHSCRVTRVSTI